MIVRYYYITYPAGINPLTSFNMPESPPIASLGLNKKLDAIVIIRKYVGASNVAALRTELNSKLSTSYTTSEVEKILLFYEFAISNTGLPGVPAHLYTPEGVAASYAQYMSILHTLATLVTYKVAAQLNPFDANGNIKYKPDVYTSYMDASGNWIYPSNDGFMGGKKEAATLKVGEIISRYGNEKNGYYASPDGTPFSARSLPPDTDLSNFHRYLVKKYIPVYVGYVAPWFYQPGGGVQYQFSQSIEWYLANKYLEELF